MKKDYIEKKELQAYLFHEGTNYHAYEFLGAFLHADGTCIFRVWAPNADKVYVTGDFCEWKHYANPMKKISVGGLYECEVCNVKEFDCYKFVLVAADGTERLKADPYAIHFETRPGTASKVYRFGHFKWTDSKWMKERKAPYAKPLNIYEVHLGSWKKYADDNFFDYEKITEELITYVKDMGYTHVELLPIMEHPFDKSWGYQVTGYFSPSSRYGMPEEFMKFVNECHRAGIGVILDWVPGHFPKDEAGLYEFDGGYVYEYADAMKREHEGWGTRVFDFGKQEVRSFLISNAIFWFEKYHIDGLRVDAVSTMIYLNHGKREGQWQPNCYGGIVNLEAVEFLKMLNTYVFRKFPEVMMIAEESTAYAKVTHPVEDGGLGFNFKWNMGWMNDSLHYMKMDPYFKQYHHNDLTFGMTYAFSENFILPISHDEVVHGKCSLLNKMPGDYHEKFSNLRTFLAYMYAHPGKKLLFMGADIAQFIEWNEENELDWNLLAFDSHRAHRDFVRELNIIYKKNSVFWELDYAWEGFRWNVVDDYSNNVLAFTRRNKLGEEILVVCHFSSQTLKGYRIGVPYRQNYKEIFSTEISGFGGSGFTNGLVKTSKKEYGGFEYSIEITIPPFCTMYFKKSQPRKKSATPARKKDLLTKK